MNSKKIGQFIALHRKELGLTQNQLAKKLNISDGAVSKWERGINFPDIAMVEELSAVLDISVMELLQGEKNQDNVNGFQINEAIHETLIYSKEADARKTKKFIRTIRLWQVLLVIFVFTLISVRPAVTIFQNQASAETYDRIMANIEVENWYVVMGDVEYYLAHYYGASKYDEVNALRTIAPDKFWRSNFGDLMSRSGLTKGELDTLFFMLKKVGVDRFASVSYLEGDINTEKELIIGYLSEDNPGNLIVSYSSRTITRLAIAAPIFTGDEPITYFTLYSDSDGFLMTFEDVKSAVADYYAKLNSQKNHKALE